MSCINRATLLGRLGGDPKIRTTQGGERVAQFSIATSESWKDKRTGEKKERTYWHNIVAWGSLAEIAERFLKKGARVYVEGPIRPRVYQNQSGQDVKITEIVLSGYGCNLTVIDWPDKQGGGGSSYSENQPQHGGDLDDEIPF